MKTQAIGKFLSRHRLIILLTLALLVGLIYVFTVPPWMHYDEPGHFEYAWLIANSDTWPTAEDYDQSMRREVVLSMIEHRFEDYTGVKMEPYPADDKPINILYTQTDDQPLYYFLASLPLRLVKNSDITYQLYAVRLVSLALLLVTVYVCYQVCRLLFGQGHPLTWMVAAFLIALPSFVDIMTAANNDVGAIASFSLFVWASVFIIQKGINLKRGLVLFGTVVLCFLSKSTAWVAIPLSVLVILLGFYKWKYYKVMWVAIGILAILGVVLVFSWKESVPALYYVETDQSALMRVKNDTAPVGEYALQHSKSAFYQMITPEAQEKIKGQTVTLGAYIWADEPTSIPFPKIGRLDKTSVPFTGEQINLTTQPAFYTFQAQIPDEEFIGWVTFYSSGNTNSYWDGIVLVPGEFNASESPVFTTVDADQGTWQGEAFTNALRNGSGELGWPLFSKIASKVIHSTNGWFYASLGLTILDYKANAWYYQTTFQRIFRTFWGTFGWGEVQLQGRYAFRILFGVTLMMVLGGLIGIIKGIKRAPWRLILFSFLSVAIEFFIVVTRGSGTWFFSRYYPVARYFYPVIIPVAIFLIWGYYQLFKLLNLKDQRISSMVVSTVYATGALALIGWGILSIAQYYY